MDGFLLFVHVTLWLLQVDVVHDHKKCCSRPILLVYIKREDDVDGKRRVVRA